MVLGNLAKIGLALLQIPVLEPEGDVQAKSVVYLAKRVVVNGWQ